MHDLLLLKRLPLAPIGAVLSHRLDLNAYEDYDTLFIECTQEVFGSEYLSDETFKVWRHVKAVRVADTIDGRPFEELVPVFLIDEDTAVVGEEEYLEHFS